MTENKRLALLAGLPLDVGNGHRLSVGDFMALFERRGIAAQVCGGIVRDVLQGEPFNDIDFTFGAHISTIRAIAETEFGSAAVRLYNPGFGLLKIGPTLESAVDMTMYRSADSVGAAASIDTVVFALGDTLDNDARIRDLSINCLYWNVADGLQDPLGHGLDDVMARRLRIAADPRKARVDPRISLRALLFGARGYAMAPDARDYVRANLAANLACYTDAGLADYISTIVRANGELAQALLAQAGPYLAPGAARERLAAACTLRNGASLAR